VVSRIFGFENGSMRSNAVIRKVLKGKLKKYRKQSGMTQEELAHKIGVSRAYVGYLEQGRNVPSLDTLSKIARALRVSVADLV